MNLIFQLQNEQQNYLFLGPVEERAIFSQVCMVRDGGTKGVKIDMTILKKIYTKAYI